MKKSQLFVCQAALAGAASAGGIDSAAAVHDLAVPDVSLSYVEHDAGTLMTATVRHAPYSDFAVFVAADPHSDLFLVGSGKIGASGKGNATIAGPPSETFGDGAKLHFVVAAGTEQNVSWSGWTGLGLNPICERLSFNHAANGNQIPAGTVISDQWAEAGLTISAESNAPRGPDQVITFDSANPTGNDPDLQTPGYGPNNDEALGNLLIIADDVVDADGDGLVDDPDDAEEGGVITLDFGGTPVTMCAIGLIDLDKGGIGSTIRFFDELGNLIDEIDLPSMGDNSFQEVNFFVEEVERVEIAFVGSGGIPHIALIPCPAVVDVDTNTFGVPLELQAGEIVTGQLNVVGVAVQNAGGGPDAAVVFDTANPTGGDPDLATPGPGLGNDEPLGQVLIIAEDAVDANADGLVDDPDDEAGGGVMRFEFPVDSIFLGATVIDVDTNETSFFDCYDADGDHIAQIPLQSLGDNSVQTVETAVPGVRAVELTLGGSGALAELVACPDASFNE